MSNHSANDIERKTSEGINACCAFILGSSNLVKCNTRAASCHWRIPISEGQLCSHPCNWEIAQGILADAQFHQTGALHPAAA